MSEQNSQLVTRVESYYNGDASYGDPMLKILEGVDSKTAIKRPADNVHSIAELIAHLVTWEDCFLERIKGNHKSQVEQELSFDWKRIDENEKTLWRTLTTKLDKNHKEIISVLNNEKYSTESKKTLMIDVTEHAIYHLGQIAIIKKMVM